VSIIVFVEAQFMGANFVINSPIFVVFCRTIRIGAKVKVRFTSLFPFRDVAAKGAALSCQYGKNL